MNRFDRRFATLVDRWKRYQDAPRDPDDLTELSESRRRLDEARAAVAVARAEIVGSVEPHPIGRTPDRIAVDLDDYNRLRVQGAIPEG